jgi:hypothetical protein
LNVEGHVCPTMAIQDDENSQDVLLVKDEKEVISDL